MPARSNSCDSTRPAGPAPTITTGTRSSLTCPCFHPGPHPVSSRGRAGYANRRTAKCNLWNREVYTMAKELNGKKIAFVTANEGVEQVELTEPWKAVEAAGGEPHL